MRKSILIAVVAVFVPFCGALAQKTIADFPAASSVSGTDFTLMQQGPAGTPYTKAQVSQFPFCSLGGCTITGATNLNGGATVSGGLGTDSLTATGAVAGATLSSSGNATITGSTTTDGLTVNGTTAHNGVVTQGSAGGTMTTPAFDQSINYSGTQANTNIIGANEWNVGSDTLAKSGQYLADLDLTHNFGGGSYSGSRLGLLVNMQSNGAISGGGIIAGGQFSVGMKNSFGGTNLNDGAAGAASSLNPFLTFGSSFTNGIGGSGIEVDLQANSGTTYRGRSGVLITHTAADDVQGTVFDAGLKFSDQSGTSSGSLQEIAIGDRFSQWPMDPNNGSILQAELGFNAATAPSSGLNGIDLLLATFSGSAFRTKGWSVDGSGDMQVGTCAYDPTSSGNSIDCTGSVGTAVSLVSGGSSWPTDANYYYATDTNGGVYTLTLSGGVVTAISIYRAPEINGTTPSNPVTLTGDKAALAWGATGLTVNLTWSARSTLALNPTSGGDVVAGASGISTSATSGFLHLPTTAGTPTGTPANTVGAACVVNTSSSALNCYFAGSWHHVAFSAGAG